MNVDDFKTLMKTDTDSRSICQTVLFSSDMWLVDHKNMGNSAKVYDQMKLFFARKLAMSNSNVAIVGSAKTGFSMNPKKLFRPFNDEDSDIDVILVWPAKYSEFWSELLHLFYGKSTYIDSNVHQDVFRKFVTLRRRDTWPSKIFQDWHQKMDGLKRDFFTEFSVGNPIKYRVYESWDAVEAYHENGISKLRSMSTGA
jgi:hypothetical protein